MNKLFWVIGIAILSLNFSTSGNEEYLKYIDEYKDIAISEMERTGIPASIKLAQAIIESNAGRSELAQNANNHFGIKCGSSWTEKGYEIKDDDYDHKGRKIKSCFRVYDDPVSSFIAHSEFLRDPKKAHRYGRLFDLEPTDYTRWAYGLRAAGYATNPKYPHIIIKVIEDYKLYKYDYVALAGKDQLAVVKKKEEKKKTNVKPQRVFQINSASCVKARKGDTPWRLADRFEVSLRQMMNYNEQFKSKVEPIEAGTAVFLQKKRKKYYGRQKHHYVKKGETMVDISMKYGVSLDGLRTLNNMPTSAEPKAGEKVALRKRAKKDASPAYYFPTKEERRKKALESRKKEEIKPDEKKEEAVSEAKQQEVVQSPSKDTYSTEYRSRRSQTASTLSASEASDGDYLPFTLTKKKVLTDAEMANVEEREKYLLLRADIPEEPEVKPKDDAYLNFVIELNKNLDTPEDEDEVVVKDDKEEKTAEYLIEYPDHSYHTVEPGDTLYSLHKKYQTTVSQLRTWNALADNTIRVGDKLRVK